MKKMILILLMVIGSVVFAKNSYISGIQKVTFRTGPGTDNKIIKMLATDEKVTVVEAGEVWTKVTDDNGTEGYILNRFISEDIPFSQKYDSLKTKFEKITEKTSSFATENKALKEVVQTLQKEIAEVKNKLAQTEKSFEELKLGSADFMGLKENYDKSQVQLNLKTKRVTELESHVNIHYIKWFLAGAGVLVIGWLIGLVSRKKKSYSGLKL